jgi:hypothetical protein
MCERNKCCSSRKFELKSPFWIFAASHTFPLILSSPTFHCHFSSKFVRAAKRCLDLGNFFSFFAILAALDAPKVNSFVRAGRGLPDKLRKLLAEMQAVTDPSRNMKAYRDLYNERRLQPRLPFLPLHLKDLYFASESLKNGEVTVKDARLVTRLVLRDVVIWQPFRMRSDYGMQGYFRVSVPLLPSSLGASRETAVPDRSGAQGGVTPVKASIVARVDSPESAVQTSAPPQRRRSASASESAASPSTPILAVREPAGDGMAAQPPSALRGAHLRTFALTSLTSPAVHDKGMRSRSTTFRAHVPPPSALRGSSSNVFASKNVLHM